MRALLVWLILVSSSFAQTAPPAAAGKFPPLNVQVAVATKQRNTPGSSYKKTMSIEPKASVEGTTRIAAIPAAELVMIVVTMDTGAKYKAGVDDAFKVHSSETLPLTEAKDGTKRSVEFKESTVTYDTARDTSNLGGAVYKYFVFGLRNAETKEIVNFQTNNPSLATFCKAHPEKRDEFLNLKGGAKFPTTFK